MSSSVRVVRTNRVQVVTTSELGRRGPKGDDGDDGLMAAASTAETIAAALTTKAVTPAGLAAAMPELNVKSYGATGNGTTNDAAAIQAAFNVANALLTADDVPGATVIFPPGAYNIGSTGLTASCSIEMKTGAYLSYSGFGTALLIDDINSAHIDVDVRRASVQWFSGVDTTSVGVSFRNCNSAGGVQKVSGFWRGVEHHGDTTGSSYSNTRVDITDCMKGWTARKTGAGWSNQHAVAGRIRITSAYEHLPGSVFIDITSSGNGSSFNEMSLEGDSPEWTVDCSVPYVKFDFCRWEASSGIRSNTSGHPFINFGYNNLGEGSAIGVPMTKNGGVFSVMSTSGCTLRFDGGGSGTGRGLDLVATNSPSNVAITTKDNSDLTRSELLADGTFKAYRSAGKGGGSFPYESVVVDGINRKLWLGDGSVAAANYFLGTSPTRVDFGPSTTTFRTLGPIEIDGMLDHDGTLVGFYGTTPVARPTSVSPKAALEAVGLGVTLVNVRVGTVTSSATPTINTDNVDFYRISALAAAITSFTTNLSGTPVDGQHLEISITDNGTLRAITWGASFEASTVALPTTTVASTRLDVEFIWNTVTSKWRCIRVS